MRRCLTIASSVLVALAIAGVPAVAQLGAVPVTATQTCTLRSDPVPCTYTASDPRVAGEVSHTFVQALSEDSFEVPGTTVALHVTDASIEGPEGTSSGHHIIVVDEDGEAHAMLMLAGAGAHEGSRTWPMVAIRRPMRTTTSSGSSTRGRCRLWAR